MGALARRLGLVLAVIVTFVALQTGSARVIDGDCTDDELAACMDGEGGPCAPSCADCHGCAGPTRALIGARTVDPLAATRVLQLERDDFELVAQRDVDRIDRPPRG